MSSMPRALVVVLLLTTIIGLRPGSASACSCLTPDPIDAIETSDLVFTGSAAGGAQPGGSRGWRFEVDGVVKGEVGPVVDVLDSGARECGSSYDDVASPLVVFASQRDEDIVAFGCMPILQKSTFEALSTEFSDPAGVGPPGALAVGRRGFADFRVLDSQGRLLGAADLEGEPYAAAHCPGTPLVAVVSLDDEFGSRLSVVDMESMDVVARLDDEIAGRFELGVGRGDISCVDGGERIVIVAGPSGGAGDRVVGMHSIDVSPTTLSVMDTLTGRGRGIIHPSGTVFLLPTRGDGRLGTAAPGSVTDIDPEFVELGEGVSAVAGAVDVDGDRLALLVTLDGRGLDEHTAVATHVMTLDIVDGILVRESVRTIALPAGRDGAGAGRPRAITWLDDTTWALERSGGIGAWIDLVGTDGTLVSSTIVDQGWGLLALDGSILRSPEVGLELVVRDGSTIDLVPAPVNVAPESPFFLAPVIDGDDLDVHLVPDVEPIVIRSVGDRDDLDEVSQEVAEPAAPEPEGVEPDIPGSVVADPLAAPDDGDTAEERQARSAGADDGSSTGALVVGIAVLLIVFVVGLRAIKHQRDEGRRSKLPPIG